MEWVSWIVFIIAAFGFGFISGIELDAYYARRDLRALKAAGFKFPRTTMGYTPFHTDYTWHP